MIIVPTHKRHKSSFKHSKTINVFTSGRVIITLQIHRTKKSFLKGFKWPVQNGPSIPEEQQDLRYPAATLNEKGCLPLWGGDALTHYAGFLFAAVFSLAKFPLKVNLQMKNSKMK